VVVVEPYMSRSARMLNGRPRTTTTTPTTKAVVQFTPVTLALAAVPRWASGVRVFESIRTLGRHLMASKDKGGSKGNKKAASSTLKEKREAKKAKKSGKSSSS
jgi:hypothetical protein